MSYTARRASRVSVGAAIALAVLAGCASSVDEGERPLTTGSPTSPGRLVSVDEFEGYVGEDDATVINVHIPYEGHIDGTDTFIAFDAIVDDPALPRDLDAPIALYCRSGNMSATATEALIDAGYTNVVDLDGGMIAWTDSGGSLVDDPEAGS